MSTQEETKVELSSMEVLEGVLARLVELYGATGAPIDLEPGGSVWTEIANDSDYHRTRIGTMSYDRFQVLLIDDRCWMVSVGRKSGSYPGDTKYRGDLIAIPIEALDEASVLEKVFRERVREGEYFYNSLLIATTSGYLAATRDSSYGCSVLESEKVDGTLVAHGAERNEEVLNLDLSPIYQRDAMYKPEAVEAYAQAVTEVLQAS